MAISVDRIRADIEAIARCTETPGEGATRPTFSRAWGEARAYVIAQAETAGCDVRTDAAGNVHARPKSLGWDAKAWLVGSHIDTVPHGGDYDGVAGVVVGLELLRSAAEDRIDSAPVELIVFAEEEGPTFGLGMLGSRAWVGNLDVARLGQLRNARGQTYLEAGAPFGVNPARLSEDRLRRDRYLGLIEVHIEQGPGMWRRDQRLAVVRAIAGRRQYAVTMFGEANHAGATAMPDRRDALYAAANLIVMLRVMALSKQMRGLVTTVGRLVNYPNAVNVIPDRVEFTIDMRAPDDALLAEMDVALRGVVNRIAKRDASRADFTETEAVPACPMDAALVEHIRRVAGPGTPDSVSGALHDSAVLAPHIPTAMLFVPSKDGISHNPAEFSRVEDIAGAAAVVERLVRRTSLRWLNNSGRDDFVGICGGFYEHSSWVAARAWARRPFASIGQLHDTMSGIVRAASVEEQLGLVRAHPDLVGRLAREGRLTRESTGEQAAAGLDSLSDEEIAAFERYNAAYRERFGFPFVICARENRKDAILAAFPRRLANSREQEIATALAEIDKIARLRMQDAIWED
jgi:OHCU decarboxylase